MTATISRLRRPRRLMAVLAIGAGLALAAGCGNASDTADINNGKTKFANLCSSCHTLAASGNAAMIAGNFSGLASTVLPIGGGGATGGSAKAPSGPTSTRSTCTCRSARCASSMSRTGRPSPPS